MRDKYYPPTYGQMQFHCIHCNVFASQGWNDLHLNLGGGSYPKSDIRSSICNHCRERAFWYKGYMIIPDESPVEPPHPDIPADCIGEYQEARSIFSRSPRSAAALLRLCIQKLMPHLGEKGKIINEDIKSLVSKGLPTMVQKALDYCRVVGNNAVHPGEISLNDTPDIAQNLFRMVNFIVEDRISRPKEIDDFYNLLPEGSREAIEKRDKG